MIRFLVHFYKEHSYEQFTEMITFMVGGCGPDYIREKHTSFVRGLHWFLCDMGESQLERMEDWLANHYSPGSRKKVNIAELLNQAEDL